MPQPPTPPTPRDSGFDGAMAEAAIGDQIIVIGTGLMAGALAAHLANAGLAVLLLDPQPSASGINRAQAAVTHQLAIDGFMHSSLARQVETGRLDTAIDRLKTTKLIFEAINEDFAQKQAIYHTLHKHLQPDTILAGHNIALTRTALLQGLPADFARHFIVTGFYWTARKRPLVELVTGPENPPDLIDRLTRFLDYQLGKTILPTRDRPGRVAVVLADYWLLHGAAGAARHGLELETAEAINIALLGLPATGLFGLWDRIGVSFTLEIGRRIDFHLPGETANIRDELLQTPIFTGMVRANRQGRATKAGFYRHSGAGRTRQSEVIDFKTLEYRPEQKPDPAAIKALARDPAALCRRDDAAGRYALDLIAGLLALACRLAEEEEIPAARLDRAMSDSFEWTHGVFALADRIGLEPLILALRAAGRPVPDFLMAAAASGGFTQPNNLVSLTPGSRAWVALPDPPDSLSLGRIKRQQQPVLGNAAAAVWDLGDGVLCLEPRTKMNTMEPDVFRVMAETIDLIIGNTARYRALVLGSDHPRAFSAGANLQALVALGEARDEAGISAFIRSGQNAYRALRAAPFPVVAAGFGLALGGGAELLMHCDRIISHSELTAGQPEIKVGLIPGWGGCTRLLARWADRLGDDAERVDISIAVFDLLASGRLSGSAADARAMGFLRAEDAIIMHPGRVLARAKAAALDLAASGYTPPPPVRLRLPGLTEQGTLAARIVDGTPTDFVIAQYLAQILVGGETGDVTEDQLYAMEHDAILALACQPGTTQRMRHMLATGKPLRN